MKGSYKKNSRISGTKACVGNRCISTKKLKIRKTCSTCTYFSA